MSDRVFSARVLAREPEAVAAVKAAIDAAGSIRQAAVKLGIGERTLHRWLSDLNINIALSQKASAGRQGGRNRWKKATKKRSAKPLKA